MSAKTIWAERLAGTRYTPGATGWLVHCDGLGYWYGPRYGTGTFWGSLQNSQIRVWATKADAIQAFRSVFGKSPSGRYSVQRTPPLRPLSGCKTGPYTHI